MDKVSMSYLFPSQDIKQNVLLSSYLDNWWRHKLLRFIFDHPLKQRPTGRKEGEDGNTKIRKSREQKKELFQWIKKEHFLKFLKGHYLLRKYKIADTNFKELLWKIFYQSILATLWTIYILWSISVLFLTIGIINFNRTVENLSNTDDFNFTNFLIDGVMGCSTKGASYCCFHKTVSNNYFQNVLLINLIIFMLSVLGRAN